MVDVSTLLTQALNGPTGPDDIGIHTGVVLTWDDLSQVNSVLIQNSVVTNLRTLQSGIGILYQPGDTVMILRKQTQYFILGKVSAPGGNNANQIKSSQIITSESTTANSFIDLATVGPTASATIGTSRRALVLSSAAVDQSFTTGAYSGGWWTLAVTGASTILPSGLSTQFPSGGFMQFEGDFIGTQAQTWIVTSTNGLNAGLNNFRLMYASVTAGLAVKFAARNITVIPF